MEAQARDATKPVQVSYFGVELTYTGIVIVIFSPFMLFFLPWFQVLVGFIVGFILLALVATLDSDDKVDAPPAKERWQTRKWNPQ